MLKYVKLTIGGLKMNSRQGYNDKLDESLGARNKGKKTQSMASRRNESKGTEKAAGNRAYAAVSTMDSSRKTPKASSKRVVNLGAGDRLHEVQENRLILLIPMSIS